MRSRILTLAAVMLAAGCSEDRGNGPPAIKYGHAECAGCGMIVSSERYASAIVLPAPSEPRDLVFDDISCMLEYETAHDIDRAALRFVHDADSLQWLPAKDATFVRNPEVHTPMGSGLQAFARPPTTMPAKSYEQLCRETGAPSPAEAGR